MFDKPSAWVCARGVARRRKPPSLLREDAALQNRIQRTIEAPQSYLNVTPSCLLFAVVGKGRAQVCGAELGWLVQEVNEQHDAAT